MLTKIQVLDKGYVVLTHKMLDLNDDISMKQTLDQQIVGSARVSYGGDLKGEEKDRKLLNYLLEHDHLSPLEQAVFRFEVKAPIYVARQWFRHRWGSFNEISLRYTESNDDYYVPEEFRFQDSKNKQGSVGRLDEKMAQNAFLDYTSILEEQYYQYQKLIALGVAREIARGILGTAYYTKFVWTVNARSLINFLILRCDKHAQLEIRQYAWTLYNILKKEIPWTIEAITKLFPESFNEN